MKINIRRIALAFLIPGLMAATPTQIASAKRTTRPGSPVVIKISSKLVQSKFQNLTVTLERPTDTGGSPVIDMTVQVGKQRCVINKKANTCTIKRIAMLGNRGPLITTWARNKVGISKKALHRGYLYSRMSWVRSGYGATGIKFPASIISREKSRVLNQNSTKWSKFQGLHRTRVSTFAVHQKLPNLNTPSVIFTVTDTIGLALPNNGMQTSSGMLAVRADGTTIDSLLPGSLSTQVRDFYSSPNGRFYVAFTGRTPLIQGGNGCVLAEVNSSTGVPTCIDESISNVALTSSYSQDPDSFVPIQFDDAGNIYYTGLINNKFVLRKSLNGATTNLINENISLKSFAVAGDGSVLISGYTTSSNTEWLRKLGPTNVLSSLVPQTSRVNFLRKFPDGNIYFGLGDVVGVRRYISNTGSLDPKYWIAYPGWESAKDAHNIFTIFYINFLSVTRTFNPAETQRIIVSSSGKVLGVLGCCNDPGALYHFYPIPQRGNTQLVKISIMKAVGTNFVLVGLNADGTNMLTLYNPETFQETVVLDSVNEVEIYSLDVIGDTNKIIFNGLRFSDNKLVVGEVDLAGV